MAEYKVQFDIFEGPLDLLLYLVKKEEVDIYQVNLTKIATQFIEYIDLMRQLDLEIAGEFLVMASTLMYIKSRELLPVDQQAAPPEEEEGEDPRWELIRQLVEYKKFKDAAAGLQTKEHLQESLYSRLPSQSEFEAETPKSPVQISIFELVRAVSSILKRFDSRDSTSEIMADPWTVSEKIESLRSMLETRPRFRFAELFDQTTSRGEVIVTFLALLELIRLKHVGVAQPEAFSEIEIVRSDSQTPETLSVPETPTAAPQRMPSIPPIAPTT
ncbi:MAG: chromosome segregation protein ScpA [Verrucomicrobia bacterium]|nr:chromosome segregation protein ScpA [Verrucomicrobiota bacterium]